MSKLKYSGLGTRDSGLGEEFEARHSIRLITYIRRMGGIGRLLQVRLELGTTEVTEFGHYLLSTYPAHSAHLRSARRARHKPDTDKDA